MLNYLELYAPRMNQRLASCAPTLLLCAMIHLNTILLSPHLTPSKHRIFTLYCLQSLYNDLALIAFHSLRRRVTQISF